MRAKRKGEKKKLKKREWHRRKDVGKIRTHTKKERTNIWSKSEKTEENKKESHTIRV